MARRRLGGCTYSYIGQDGVCELLEEGARLLLRDAAAGDGGMRITGTDSEPIRKFGCKYTKFTMEKSENSDD